MDAPAADDDSLCPRCGQAFHCGAHDAAPCPCGTLKLPPETLATLRGQYSGCLCLRCLAELAAAGRPAISP